MIEFHEYAEINVPDMWPSQQNPVAYKNTEGLDIDFDNLDFKPVPKRDMDFIRNHLGDEFVEG